MRNIQRALLPLALVCLLALTSCDFLSPGGSSTTQTCSGSAGATGATSTEVNIAKTVFAAINRDRASNGVNPLAWCPNLANSSRQHDLAMAAVGILAHQLDGEADLGERETQQGVSWSEAGENIGYVGQLLNVDGALELHQAMMAEQPPDDGHRQNILSPDFTVVGVDILLDRHNDVLWLTEDFAQLASQ